MSLLLANFTEPLVAVRARIREGQSVSLDDIQAALVQAGNVDGALQPDEADRIGRSTIEPALQLARALVDEVICRAASTHNAGDAAFQAIVAGDAILRAFDVRRADIEAQSLWWRVLYDYTRGRSTFTKLHADLSPRDREHRSAQALLSGVTMLMHQRFDLAVTCFDYAFAKTGARLPITDNAPLSEWITEVEPEGRNDRLRMRRLLVVETLTKLTDERAREGFSATAETLLRRRARVLGPLTESALPLASYMIRHYQYNAPMVALGRERSAER